MLTSTWLHLRIPFALYILPVFAFAASQYPFSDLKTLMISFVAIHLFLYPACHGYNSYFDKDKESIGGLEEPPPVKQELYYVSLIFDLIAIGLGLLINWQFALMLFILGLESKAYSHPLIRLKKYSIPALLITSVFQGGFTYMMSSLALHHLNFNQLIDAKILIPALLCTISFIGFYPMTQIYQHYEDSQRGDKTISLQLGKHGTFIFSAIVLLLSNFGFYLYFTTFFREVVIFTLFEICLLPLIVFFIAWYVVFYKDARKANYRNAMLLNKISTACALAFFLIFALVQIN